MKAISAALTTHLEGEEHTLCTCLLITRRDGEVFGFTDHDQDITLGAQTYKASNGYSRTSVEGEANLAVTHAELGGLLDDIGVKEADILARKFDGAAVALFQVNFLSLGDGTIPLLYGKLGRLSPQGQGYTAELLGLARRLERAVVVETYTVECAADLFDARCAGSRPGKSPIAAINYTGTVDTVTSRREFTSTATPAGSPAPDLGADPTFFHRGKITWTSGANNGLSMEIRSYDDATKTFVLPVPMPNGIQPGDTFTLQAGCDKKFTTCRDRHDNAVNFRGFHLIPASDKLKPPVQLVGGGYPSSH